MTSNRGSYRAFVGLAVLSVVVAGCGDDDAGTDAGPGTDAGADSSVDPDGGRDASAEDAGGADGSNVDAAMTDAGPVETVTVTGLVRGEDVGSGPPPLPGATVSILWPDGTTFDTGTTDDAGSYTVTAARGMLMLHRVEPVTGYLGNVRGEMVRNMDYMAYDVVLAERAGVEAVVSDAGSTYDPSLAYLVAGYNPVSYEDGGEGATLSGATHDDAFILYPVDSATTTMVTNVLPPICGSGETPEADGCALDGRLNQVFFPNVAGGPVSVDIIDPAGGTCAERFGITAWPVFADTVITVNIDCTAT